MQLQPIVYTENVPAVVEFYAKVLGIEPVYRSDMWTAFAVAGGTLGIHKVEQLPDGKGTVELSLVATEPLEAVVTRLEAAGLVLERGIKDEAFGRSILLRDPDGSPVQVNEHHR
jgi:catechol 2,3-dioxygenase-like lactoylglutathione lyase family enzyme